MVCYSVMQVWGGATLWSISDDINRWRFTSTTYVNGGEKSVCLRGGSGKYTIPIRSVYCIFVVLSFFSVWSLILSQGGKNVDAFQITETIKLSRKGGSLHIISWYLAIFARTFHLQYRTRRITQMKCDKIRRCYWHKIFFYCN